MILGIFDYYGIIWHNSLFTWRYPVHGLDVSHHQGYIDWEQVKKKYRFFFVYMKATEGNDFIDQHFQRNWQQTRSKGWKVGAYHFFTMGSSGREQANHFIRTVPKSKENLPPVIDVEISLHHSPSEVRLQLQEMMDLLEMHYEKKPILYVTYDTYDRYIKNHFQPYPLWIRDVFKFPTIGSRDWLLWQYHNRGRVAGIKKPVDINVFAGSERDFQNWIQP